MSNEEILKVISKTNFFRELIKNASKGDIFSRNERVRRNAWGFWVIDSLREFKGNESREYIGLILPGKFYSPNNSKEAMTPHLELSQGFLNGGCKNVSSLIANAGNAILSNAWVYSEVKSFKKALVSSSVDTENFLIEKLYEFREPLVRELNSINNILKPDWDEFERLIVTSPEKINEEILKGFNTNEITSLLQKVGIEFINIQFEESLLNSNGENTIKRIGVWSIDYKDREGSIRKVFALTPRLTRNNMFTENLYIPEKEGILALIVRVLLMRKIYSIINESSLTRGLIRETSQGVSKPYYKAIVPKVGEKLPEASTDAAVLLLQTFPTAELAWGSLIDWASDEYVITVSKEQFKEAFTNAKQKLKRAETPDRETIDILLSLFWDKKSRVIRVTFAKPKNKPQSN